MSKKSQRLIVFILSAIMLSGCWSDDDEAVADAGAALSVKERRSIVVSEAMASGEGAVTVAWTQISGPQLSLTGADTLTPQITAPSLDADAAAVLRLTVTDSKGQIAEDDLTVNVTNNTLPVLTAGLDAIAEKTEVALTAPLSDDGQIVAVSWQQTAGPDVTLSGTDSETISFTSPAVTEVTSLTFMLSATDDDDETAAFEISINVEPNLLAFSLSGSVSGADFGGGNAVLTGASEVITSQIDENGAFSFDLKLDDDSLDSVVAVSVSAAAGSRLKYSAVYTGFAEPEVVVTSSVKSKLSSHKPNAADVSHSIAVTSISTALYSLLVTANGGVLPANIEQLAFVEKSIDADELAEAAAVVKILTDNEEIVLPEGISDITELLLNIAAYNAMVEQIETAQSGLIESTIVAIVADPTLTPPLAAESIAPVYFSTYATVPGFLAQYGERWQFNLNSSCAYARPTGNFSCEWQIAEGKINVDFVEPAVLSATTYPTSVAFTHLTQQQVDWLLADNITTVTVVNAYESTEFARLVQIGNLEIFRRKVVTSRSVRPIQTSQGVVSFYSESESEYNFIMRRPAQSETQFDAENLPGTWAINTYFTQVLRFQGPVTGFYLDPLVLSSDGTGYGDVTKRAFSWQLIDGMLHINFSDNTKITAEVIDVLNDKFQVFISAYNASNQLIAAQAHYGFKLDSTLSASEVVSAPSSYWQTMINADTKYYWSNGRLLFCVDDPSCTNTPSDIAGIDVFGWSFLQNGQGIHLTGFSWVENNLPPNFNYVQTPLAWVANDVSNVSISYASRNRFWTLLKIENGILGRRLYVREDALHSTGELSVGTRLNIYEEIPLDYWNETAPDLNNVVSTMVNTRKVLKPSRAN